MAALAAGCVLLSVGAAGAHGGTWRVHQILHSPVDESVTVLRSDVWGTVITRDGGRSWEWLCSEVYGATSAGRSAVALEFSADGHLFAAAGFRGLFVSADLCDWQPVEPFVQAGRCGTNPCVVNDVVAAPGDGSLWVLTATGNDAGGIETQIFRDEEAGARWRETVTALPSGFAGQQLGVAPSNPSWAYLTGAVVSDVGARFVLHSSDGLKTWQSTRVALGAAVAPTATLRIQDIHPSEPQKLFLWLDYPPDEGSPDDVLLYSSDAAATVTAVFAAPGDLYGFSFSPDGSQVVVGGDVAGLWQATVADLDADAASAFSQVSPAPAWALQWTPDGLFAGLDDFSTVFPRLSYGWSETLGVPFQRLMSVCDVQLIACGDATTAGGACASQFFGAGNFEQDFIINNLCGDADGSLPPSVAPPDAHRTTESGGQRVDSSASPTEDRKDPSAAASGCDCQLGAVPRGGAWWLLIAFVGLAARRH